MYPKPAFWFNVLFSGRTQSTNENEPNVCQENFTFNDMTSSVKGDNLVKVEELY